MRLWLSFLELWWGPVAEVHVQLPDGLIQTLGDLERNFSIACVPCSSGKHSTIQNYLLIVFHLISKWFWPDTLLGTFCAVIGVWKGSFSQSARIKVLWSTSHLVQFKIEMNRQYNSLKVNKMRITSSITFSARQCSCSAQQAFAM